MPNLNLWPILEQLSIRTKGARTVQLRRTDATFGWSQGAFVAQVEEQYNAGRPVRIIVLKGRQLGISTITEAILFTWSFLHPGSNALVLSREKTESQYLFEMSKRYWTDGPFGSLYRTKYLTKETIVFDEPLGSSIRVATATKDEVGRGRTIQACHCSEVAFWGDRADTILPGLANAIPEEHGTIWVHESTAQGVGGYFHDEWMKAVDPTSESMFVPMFFPWFLHDEYETPTHQLNYRDLDDDEEEVVELLLGKGVDPKRVLAKIAWRRRRIATMAGGVETFHQEYPCTPEEAFLSTGTNVFPVTDLFQCYQQTAQVDRGFLYNDNGKLAFQESDNGHWTVYKTPDRAKRQKYVIGVDPTKTLEGDPCCIQVLNRATLEQVAVWHGHADMASIGEIALAGAYWYHTAIVNTEIQGGGRAVMDVWREAKYKNIWTTRKSDRVKHASNLLGIYTTRTYKNQLLATVQSHLKRHDVVIHHPTTYYEMTQYVMLETGTFGPARRSGHDDCVMAYAIALYTAVTEQRTLDLPAVMGIGGPAPPPGPPGGAGLIIPGQGTPVAHVPGVTMTREASPYFVDGEIDDWTTWG